MEISVYIIIGLVFVAVLYAAVKAKGIIQRVGLMRFFSALSTLIGAVMAAGWKLFAGGRTTRSSGTEPLDLSGTGGRYNARTGNYDNGQDPYGIYPDDDRRL